MYPSKWVTNNATTTAALGKSCNCARIDHEADRIDGSDIVIVDEAGNGVEIVAAGRYGGDSHSDGESGVDVFSNDESDKNVIADEGREGGVIQCFFSWSGI